MLRLDAALHSFEIATLKAKESSLPKSAQQPQLWAFRSHTRQSVGSHVLANAATITSVQNPQTLQAARNVAAERIWFAFEKMPIQFRDDRWPGILGLHAPLQRTPEQTAAMLEKLIPITEQA